MEEALSPVLPSACAAPSLTCSGRGCVAAVSGSLHVLRQTPASPGSNRAARGACSGCHLRVGSPCLGLRGPHAAAGNGGKKHGGPVTALAHRPVGETPPGKEGAVARSTGPAFASQPCRHEKGGSSSPSLHSHPRGHIFPPTQLSLSSPSVSAEQSNLRFTPFFSCFSCAHPLLSSSSISS